MKTKFETWRIKEHSNDVCYWQKNSWCEAIDERCAWDICPYKVENSHCYEDTYGNIIENIN